MIPRFLSPPAAKSFFLLGAKGSGKTAWLLNHYKNSLYLDLAREDIAREIASKPKGLSSLLSALLNAKTSGPVILDEIHSRFCVCRQRCGNDFQV